MSPATATDTFYRIESIKAAVQATIRAVTSPAVREVMWSAYQAAIEQAAADSADDVMPWEKASETTIITEQAAERAMVTVLEAITDISYRHQVRDLLAMELEFAEPEGEGIRVTCQKCGRTYRARSTRSKWCGKRCRQAAYQKRRKEREAQSQQTGSQEQPHKPASVVTAEPGMP
jgi:hypothetical protein